MKSILVVDYECGNLGCVSNALSYLNYQVDIVSIANLMDIDPSGQCVLLPGVGNYSYAINKIKDHISLTSLKHWLLSSEKLMCICLGFQLLYQASHETNNLSPLDSSSPVQGLSIFSSSVLPLGNDFTPSLNVGWRRPLHHENTLHNISSKSFESAANHSFYHMHSYGLPLNVHSSNDLASYDWYVTSKHLSSDIEFITAFLSKNILGLQFHPEKSGEHGLSLIKNFFD